MLQTLRQPLENGGITLTRADGTYSFPARFQLLAATNPCPCGYFGDPTGRCKCSPAAVQMYQNRIGGPLLDRIDIRIDVWRSDSRELLGRELGMDIHPVPYQRLGFHVAVGVRGMVRRSTYR